MNTPPSDARQDRLLTCGEAVELLSVASGHFSAGSMETATSTAPAPYLHHVSRADC